MRVDHRGTHIGMAEQFLHRPDVVPRFEQVGGETVPETVARSPLGNSGSLHGTRDRAAHRPFMGMMPTLRSRPRIDGHLARRKDVLPLPFFRRVRQLAIECIWKVNGTEPGGNIFS